MKYDPPLTETKVRDCHTHAEKEEGTEEYWEIKLVLLCCLLIQHMSCWYSRFTAEALAEGSQVRIVRH